MPELPRKLGLPVEEKPEIDRVAETPTPRAMDLSSAETEPQDGAWPTATPAPAPATPLPQTADDSLPIPPASDEVAPAAEIEEPIADPKPDPGEAAAIGAMSAAEAAVRQRAEADYQRAVDDAIRAAQWRTDDAVYVELVDELLRLRGSRGNGPALAAADAAGDYGRPPNAKGMAQRTGMQEGIAAHGAFGQGEGGTALRGGPRLRPAVYGSDDERVRAEQVQFFLPLPMPLPPPPVGTRPGQMGRPGYPYPGQIPGYYGPTIDLDKLRDSLPGFGDLPKVDQPVLMQLLAAILLLLYNKPPHDAKDKEGAKAPGKPGEAEGFRDPKGGEQWVKNPNADKGGASHGWLDDKGRIWVPTGPRPGRAHGGPHWDVQYGKRHEKHINIRPGKNIDEEIRKRGG